MLHQCLSNDRDKEIKLAEDYLANKIRQAKINCSDQLQEIQELIFRGLVPSSADIVHNYLSSPNSNVFDFDIVVETTILHNVEINHIQGK